MARPVWNGSISFGLLNVPVQIFSGERTVDLHFRLLDSRDKKPIRYERVNSDTGEEVAWKDIVKAFEYEKGNYVVIGAGAACGGSRDYRDGRNRSLRRARCHQPD